MAAGRVWIDALPDELAAQRRVLSRLMDFCEADGRVRWPALSCSLARGAADRLSDVDAGIGVADGLVEQVTGELAGHDLGERVETLVQHWPGAHPMRRLFVQFTDDAQLDLVVMPAAARPGRAPDELALLDRDGQLARPFTPGADVVDAGTVRAWAFLGWAALTDLAKYLRRGSLWEAHARLEEARDRVWTLWAAGRGARYPAFGLSQVLDHDPHDLPPGIGGTLAPLEPDALREAALRTARTLETVSAAAAAAHGARLPHAMARYTAARLAALPPAPPAA